MNRTPFRFAVAVSASLLALPALAAEPSYTPPTDWPTIVQPRPARVMHAQPAGSPTSFSADPTWPADPTPMPTISYAARTDPSPVFSPPVEAHNEAMAAARAAAKSAAPSQLAVK